MAADGVTRLVPRLRRRRRRVEILGRQQLHRRVEVWFQPSSQRTGDRRAATWSWRVAAVLAQNVHEARAEELGPTGTGPEPQMRELRRSTPDTDGEEKEATGNSKNITIFTCKTRCFKYSTLHYYTLLLFVLN